MGKIYYIADMHFGHKNIMKHSRRPFDTVEEMDQTILSNINSTITNNDTLYILGDVAMDTKIAISYLKRMKGRKILVEGNHDKKLVNALRREGGNVVDGIHKYMEIKDNGRKVILFHYPIAEWNGFFHNSYHVFGHIHNNNKNPVYDYMLKQKNAFNAGVDETDFMPRTLDELIEIKKGKMI